MQLWRPQLQPLRKIQSLSNRFKIEAWTLCNGHEWIGECNDQESYGHSKIILRILDGQPDQVKIAVNGYNAILPVMRKCDKWEYYQPKYFIDEKSDKWEYYQPKHFIDEMLTALYARYIDDLITGDADGIPKQTQRTT